MSSDLEGKVALVTGASRGIGQAIAVKLASCGALVGVNYHNSDRLAEGVVKEITMAGGEAFTFKADVRDAAAVKAMVKAVTSRWGRLDILVNNAGLVRNELLLGMSEEAWDEVLDTNLKGAYLCSKYALRPMLDREWGRIINISSVCRFERQLRTDKLLGRQGRSHFVHPEPCPRGRVQRGYRQRHHPRPHQDGYDGHRTGGLPERGSDAGWLFKERANRKK